MMLVQGRLNRKGQDSTVYQTINQSINQSIVKDRLSMINQLNKAITDQSIYSGFQKVSELRVKSSFH